MGNQVKKAVARGAAIVAESLAARFHDVLNGAEDFKFESPFEEDFFCWWIAIKDTDAEYYFKDILGLSTQHEVKVGGRDYRLDFTICWEDPPDYAVDAYHMECEVPFPKIAIEVDGHDFHERTKEQVAYRDKRDRDLQVDGWIVFHVSGSAFYRNPEKLVRELIEKCSKVVSTWYFAQTKALRLARIA